MSGDSYYFWLGSELVGARPSDRATHERSQSTLSPPDGGYPSRELLLSEDGVIYEVWWSDQTTTFRPSPSEWR
jgi:hypothetical protein